MLNKHSEIGETERKELALETISYFWIQTFNFWVDYLGPEQALRLMRPMLHELGAKGALTNKERLKLKDDGLASIVECLDFIFDCVSMKSELTFEPEKGRGEWIITSCPFSKASPELCDAFEIITASLVEEINPEMNGHHYQMVSKGHPFCRYVVESKEDYMINRLCKGIMSDTDETKEG